MSIDPRPLEAVDPEVAELIARDVERQSTHIQLIASENYSSIAVMQAVGSVLANKYSEGYPGRRYYEGCQVIDEIEQLAIDRAKSLFGADHANVQPHSGSQANMAAYLAVLEPGDTILGMALDQGGHLTHGSRVNFSGKLFNFVAYGVDPDSELIDMDDVHRLAVEHQPKMIIAGYSSYSRILDWARFREIADEVGAIFLVDAAHIIGLIAGGAHPSPVPHAHIVTATTHKALRGPRGGLILTTDEHAKAIDKAVFPFAQGGAINHQIAAKAVGFRINATREYADYAHQVVRNAATMAETMSSHGARVVSGGTENHMFLVDLRSIDEELTGKDAARLLDEIGITLNFNTIPFDPRKPAIGSGLRIGTPSVTTIGMKQEQMVTIGGAIIDALRRRDDEGRLVELSATVGALAAAFPPYPDAFTGHV
ncbi:MAG: serine hydroxymethyltransferase [Acidimicrobiia bacterium]|nr:serine hydroxymethyltransferase [Acidimicrobiia bacterium]NNK92552.1 serine hydroxymethyltransferase [Acidimicrobiia bacterium]